jgi:hypothetical protein
MRPIYADPARDFFNNIGKAVQKSNANIKHKFDDLGKKIQQNNARIKTNIDNNNAKIRKDFQKFGAKVEKFGKDIGQKLEQEQFVKDLKKSALTIKKAGEAGVAAFKHGDIKGGFANIANATKNTLNIVTLDNVNRAETIGRNVVQMGKAWQKGDVKGGFRALDTAATALLWGPIFQQKNFESLAKDVGKTGKSVGRFVDDAVKGRKDKLYQDFKEFEVNATNIYANRLKSKTLNKFVYDNTGGAIIASQDNAIGAAEAFKRGDKQAGGLLIAKSIGNLGTVASNALMVVPGVGTAAKTGLSIGFSTLANADKLYAQGKNIYDTSRLIDEKRRRGEKVTEQDIKNLTTNVGALSAFAVGQGLSAAAFKGSSGKISNSLLQDVGNLGNKAVSKMRVVTSGLQKTEAVIQKTAQGSSLVPQSLTRVGLVTKITSKNIPTDNPQTQQIAAKAATYTVKQGLNIVNKGSALVSKGIDKAATAIRPIVNMIGYTAPTINSQMYKVYAPGLINDPLRASNNLRTPYVAQGLSNVGVNPLMLPLDTQVSLQNSPMPMMVPGTPGYPQMSNSLGQPFALQSQRIQSSRN